MTDIQTQLASLNADDFRQDQTRVCTIMAFLIGVDWQKCSFSGKGFLLKVNTGKCPRLPGYYKKGGC